MENPDFLRANQRNMINVRRNHVLQDGLAKISTAAFIPSRELSVRLAIKELFDSSIFSGEPGRKVLVPNSKGKVVLFGNCNTCIVN